MKQTLRPFRRLWPDSLRVLSAALVSLVFALCFSLGWAADHRVTLRESVVESGLTESSITDCRLGELSLGHILLLWVCFFGLVGLLWALVDAAARRPAGQPRFSPGRGPARLWTAASPRRRWLLCQGGLLLCWLPVWLAAWPGFFCYDAQTEYNSWAGLQAMTDHQPIFHTALLGGLIRLGERLFGSTNAGIALFFAVQLLLLSALFTLVLCTLRRAGVGRWMVGLAFFWYALFPTCVLFALCSTKDSLFSAAALLLCLQLRRLLKSPSDYFARFWPYLCLALTVAVTLLLRKNALYALLALLPFLLLCVRGARLRTAAALLAGVLLFSGSARLLASATGATHSDQTNDMLCVPAQQLARIYQTVGPDFFTEPERECLLGLAPSVVWRSYNSFLADPVKLRLDTDYFRAHKRELLHVWLNALTRDPLRCVEATLLNTYQSWYPGAPVTGYQEVEHTCYGDGISSYFECRVEEPGVADSKLPALFRFYWNISRMDSWRSIPGLNLLFSVGFHFWVLLWAAGYCLAKRRWGALVLFLFPLLLFGTVLLGPVALVRYNLLLFWGLPLWGLLVRDAAQTHFESAHAC